MKSNFHTAPLYFIGTSDKSASLPSLLTLQRTQFAALHPSFNTCAACTFVTLHGTASLGVHRLPESIRILLHAGCAEAGNMLRVPWLPIRWLRPCWEAGSPPRPALLLHEPLAAPSMPCVCIVKHAIKGSRAALQQHGHLHASGQRQCANHDRPPCHRT